MPPGIVVNLRGFFVKPEPPNILIYPSSSGEFGIPFAIYYTETNKDNEYELN